MKSRIMNLQYISDSKGQTTGVFIPINEWNDLKSKYTNIEQEEINAPDWQKDLVLKRLGAHQLNPSSVLDFDSSLDDIENEL